MTIAETKRAYITALTPLYGEREAAWLARMALEHVMGKDEVWLLINAYKETGEFYGEKLDHILKRLLAHEPIQYITGTATFRGLELHVTPDTLIPRPETAQLVDLIVDENSGKEDLRVLDLGTGSGCIAIALALNLPFARVKGIDISRGAVEVARENTLKLKARADFEVGDILSLPSSSSPLYDIIVSNPPYIAEKERDTMERNVLDYEPGRALFVPDDDPLKFYRAITRYAREALGSGGRLYFEINPLYASAMREMAVDEGFEDIDILRDSFGKYRFLSATRP